MDVETVEEEAVAGVVMEEVLVVSFVFTWLLENIIFS